MNYSPTIGTYQSENGQAQLYSKPNAMISGPNPPGSLYVEASNDFTLDYGQPEPILKNYCYEHYITPQQHHSLSPAAATDHTQLINPLFHISQQQPQHSSPEALPSEPGSYIATGEYDTMQAHGTNGAAGSVKQLSPEAISFGLMPMAGVDYPDINSLEPSFLPGQVDLCHRGLMQQGMDCSGANAGVPLTGNESLIFQGDHGTTVAYTGGHMNQCHLAPFHGAAVCLEGCDDDESHCFDNFKRPPNELAACIKTVRSKRQGRKRKPKKDPNEPQKPVSAYALFFRDTQATIKGQNPNASFGEVSKIVATMWDGLNSDAKNVYKQKTESAKKDYLKQLAAYRANLLSKGNDGSCVLQSCSDYYDQRKFLFPQTLPDSTSVVTESVNASQEFSSRTLASLIAEPTPQQVLTATTTLTVPQSSCSSVSLRRSL